MTESQVKKAEMVASLDETRRAIHSKLLPLLGHLGYERTAGGADLMAALDRAAEKIAAFDPDRPDG